MTFDNAAMRGLAVAVTIAIAAAAGTAQAREDGAGRFTMSPTDGGFVRLDTRNGDMAFCQKTEDDWACEAMADTAQAQAKELAALRQENAALKATVRRLEDALARVETPSGPKAPGLSLPSEKQVEETLNYFENILRKFQDRLRRLEKTPPETEPGDGERQL